MRQYKKGSKKISSRNSGRKYLRANEEKFKTKTSDAGTIRSAVFGVSV